MQVSAADHSEPDPAQDSDEIADVAVSAREILTTAFDEARVMRERAATVLMESRQQAVSIVAKAEQDATASAETKRVRLENAVEEARREAMTIALAKAEKSTAAETAAIIAAAETKAQHQLNHTAASAKSMLERSITQATGLVSAARRDADEIRETAAERLAELDDLEAQVVANAYLAFQASQAEAAVALGQARDKAQELQAAANQARRRAKRESDQMLDDATAKVSQTKAASTEVLESARDRAHRLVGAAQAEAQRLRDEAHETAQRIVADARAQAASLDRTEVPVGEPGPNVDAANRATTPAGGFARLWHNAAVETEAAEAFFADMTERDAVAIFEK